MFKRNICSFLLILVMLVSCIVAPFVQLSPVHAATNKEQAGGIEYVNKKLGFSLILPKSWEGNYTIKEENGLVRFLFTYKGKTNDNIPPLFTISYEPKKEEGWNEGLRWMGELGTKNDMGYYCFYDALYLYRDGIPPGEEQDTVLAMLGQISEVFDSFKMLETDGAVAIDKEAKGDTAEEATNQEQINGIEYVNEKLGFMLTLPQSWKDHYIIKENENGSITFKFKFDGKAYEDIFLFDIFIENKELSSEEQETLGDVGVLGIKNGKTYLISPNVGLYFYNNYDDYFPSVPKEGRSVIEAMSKQIGDINFKVLEGAVAKEAKEDTPEAATAGEATDQEQASGIKYVNNRLGFSLSLPHYWKGKYTVEELKELGTDKVEFSFKRENSTYREPVFTIHIYNEESDDLKQESGFLKAENGKTYLLSVNYAMRNYDRYDELFPDATKEEHDVIATMSKQVKDISASFQVLSNKGVEAGGIKEKQGKRPKKAREKSGGIGETHEPTDVTFYKETTTSPHFDQQTFYILKTPINNIRTEVIKKPVSQTKYTGINGGFYAPSYNSELDYSEYKPYNISYYNPNKVTDGSDEINEINGLHRKGKDAEKEEEKNEPKPYSLPTLVTYYDKDLQKTKAKIIKAKNLDEIRDHFKDNPNLELINAIGGKDFGKEYWGGEGFIEKFNNYYVGPARRTILAFEEDKDTGIVYAYLIITANEVSVQTLKSHIEKLGFNKEKCILLDGSGSSSMRVWDSRKDKLIFLDKGTENSLGSKLEELGKHKPNLWEKKAWDILLADPPIANRYSYNMIRVINTEDIGLGEPEK